MAIHIDIFAHLQKNQLYKEGDQLKRYVESLEKDVNARWVQGAQGRSQKLIKLNDATAKSYDSAVNARDSAIKSLEREAAAIQALDAVSKRTATTKKAQAKLDQEKAAAVREVAAAEQDRVYALQRYNEATRVQTRAQNDLNVADREHTAQQRDIGLLLRNNTKRFTKHKEETDKARQALTSLNVANRTLIKDNRAITDGLTKVRDLTAKTTEARGRLNKVTNDTTATYAQLKSASDGLKNAHKAENRAILEVTRRIGDLTGQQKKHNVTAEAGKRALSGYTQAAREQRQQIKDLTATHQQAIQGNSKLSKSFDTASASAKSASREYKEYRKMSRDGTVSQEALRKKAERVSDAFQRQARDVDAASKSLVDLLTGQRQSAAFVRTQSDSMRDYASSARAAQQQIESLRASHGNQIRDSGYVSRAFNTVTNSIKRAADTHAEYDRLVQKGASRDELERSAKKTSDAYRQQRIDVNEATEALRRHTKEQKGKDIRGLTGGGGEYLSRNIAALTPLGRVNAGVGLPLLGMAANFGEAIVTASQSLALLPALATSAAAAIGTLAIGFHGFFDTVGDMGDPKKFAEGLQMLAPNAQQAALEIKALVDGPLGDLKEMVQNNLFDGVAQQIHSLSDVFGPQMSDLFGGVATSLNKAFMGLTNQLMTPEAQASITATIDNIVAGFDHMLPMLGPITSAFLTLTEVGSSFLPSLGDSFTKVANQFNDFIQQAARDGSLQNFIQKGIDAAGELFDFLKRAAVAIYDVFGNKSPEDFRATLDATLSIVTTLAKAIQALGTIVNAVLPYFGAVADAIGGWEELLSTIIGTWLGYKMVGAINNIIKLFGGAGIAGAMSKLPAVAATASTGIAAAFAKIKIPGALLGLLKFAPALGLGYAVYDSFSEDGAARTSATDTTPFMQTQPGLPGGAGAAGPRSPADIAMERMGLGPGGARDYTQRRPGVGTLGAGWNTSPAQSGWSPRDVPTYTDPKDFQSTPGTFELSNIPVGQFGGAPWQVPQGVTDLPADYDNIGKTGFYRSDPLKVMQEQGDMQAAQVKAEEERIKFLALQADSTTKQDELNAQRQNVIDAEQTWLQSVRNLKEAERGEFEDLTSTFDKMSDGFKNSLGDFGDVIDKDFGISKGLPGIAENLFKFVATLAAAPLMGVGKAEQAKAGFPGGKGVGYGLLGILDAQRGNYSMDLKGQADQTRAAYGVQQYGMGTVGPNGLQQTLAPGSLSPGNAGSDYKLVPGLASMNDIIASKFPLAAPIGGYRANGGGHNWHPNGEALDIPVDADQINGGKTAGSKGLGDRIWNWMQGTGVFDMNYSLWQQKDHFGHIHAQLKKQYEGMNFGGGAGLPPGAGGGGPVPDWDRIAAAESGTRDVIGSAQWNIPGGTLDSSGGLQIRQGTWNDFGGQAIAPSPWQATKEQQISVAEKILAKQGPEAWAGGDNFYTKDGAPGMAGMPPLAAEAGFAGAAGGLGAVPSGVVPVFVTNMGGGFGGGGGGFGGAAGGSGGSGGDFSGPGGAPGVPAGTTSIPGGGSGGGGGGRGGGAFNSEHPSLPPVAKGGPSLNDQFQAGFNARKPGGSGVGSLRDAWASLVKPGSGPGNSGPGFMMPEFLGGGLKDATAAPGSKSLFGVLGDALGNAVADARGPAGLTNKGPSYFDQLPADLQRQPGGPGGPLALQPQPHFPMGPSGEYGPPSGDFPRGDGGVPGVFGALNGGPGNTGSNPLFGPAGAPANWNPSTGAFNSMTGAMSGIAPPPGFQPPFGAWTPSALALQQLQGGMQNNIKGPEANRFDLTQMPNSLGDYAAQQSAAEAERRRRESLIPSMQYFPGALMPSPPGFAKGGEIPIVAHSGEHMLTSKDVSAMGGQSAVYDFRNALHYDTGGAIQFGSGAAPAIPARPKNENLSVGTYSAPAPTPKPQAPQMPGIIEPTSAPKPPPPPAVPPQPGMPGGPAVTPQPGGPNGPPLAAEAGYVPGGGEQAPVGVPTIGTPIGGQVDPDTGYGDGAKFTGGGLAGAAEGAAAAAGGLGGPAGAAGIQTAMKLGERAIEFGAQATAIGVQGLMQTFLPSGGSELANNNWLTRIVGGIAGAAPAIANVAGGAGAQLGAGAGLPGVGPATPEQLAQQGLPPQTPGVGTGPAPGPVSQTGVHIENYITSDNRAAGQDINRQVALPGTR